MALTTNCVNRNIPSLRTFHFRDDQSYVCGKFGGVLRKAVPVGYINIFSVDTAIEFRGTVYRNQILLTPDSPNTARNLITSSHAVSTLTSNPCGLPSPIYTHTSGLSLC